MKKERVPKYSIWIRDSWNIIILLDWVRVYAWQWLGNGVESSEQLVLGLWQTPTSVLLTQSCWRSQNATLFHLCPLRGNSSHIPARINFIISLRGPSYPRLGSCIKNHLDLHLWIGWNNMDHPQWWLDCTLVLCDISPVSAPQSGMTQMDCHHLDIRTIPEVKWRNKSCFEDAL